MPEVINVREDGSRDVSFFCEGESLTKQSEAAACDINRIMAKYERTGVLSHVAENVGFYADVSNVPDYQAALAVVESAQGLFASIPAEIRARFDNDPAQFLHFVSDPANKPELVKLGFLKEVVDSKTGAVTDVPNVEGA